MSRNSPLSDGVDSPDVVIYYCQQNGLRTRAVFSLNLNLELDFPHTIPGPECVMVGNIAFQAHKHSTGCGARGWIVAPDGDCFEFLNGTWWYSSAYTFNEFKWENGAWDHAVSEALGVLKQERAADMALRAMNKADKSAQVTLADKRKRRKFEDLF